MKKSNIIIILVIILLILYGLIFYFFFYNKNETKLSNISNEAVELSYEEDDTDFSSYTEKTIDLDDEDNKVSITSGGIYHLTGTLDGYIYIKTSSNIKIILDNVTINSSNNPCIYIEDADNVYIELVGENNLEDGATYKLTDINGAIYSESNLYLTGTGTLNITSNYEDAIVSKKDLVILNGTYNIESNDDGIRGKDSVTIVDGTINIKANGDGIKSTEEDNEDKGYIYIIDGTLNLEVGDDGLDAASNIEIDNGTIEIKTGSGASLKESSERDFRGNNNEVEDDTETKAKGISSNGSILINGGTININSEDDSLNSNTVIVINDGNLNLSSGDDGIHADYYLTINNGTININMSYEGLEANNITINDGTINITASDDGINANGGDEFAEFSGTTETQYSDDGIEITLVINGGTLVVDASGDGLDSNGSMVVNGGNIKVQGPTNSGNGPIDYATTFEITGGTFIAAGSSGMMQHATESNQGTVLVYFDSTSESGTEIKIGDITYTITKESSCILVSSNTLELGENYTVYINDTEYEEFTLDDYIVTVGSQSNSSMPNNQEHGSRRK